METKDKLLNRLEVYYKEFKDLSFPITEAMHNEVLSLPISSILTEDEITEIINVVKQF